MFEIFRVESCSPQGFAAYTRMKNADWLDVVASRDLTGHDPGDLRMRATNQPSSLPLHTQEILRMTGAGLSV